MTGSRLRFVVAALSSLVLKHLCVQTDVHYVTLLCLHKSATNKTWYLMCVNDKSSHTSCYMHWWKITDPLQYIETGLENNAYWALRLTHVVYVCSSRVYLLKLWKLELAYSLVCVAEVKSHINGNGLELVAKAYGRLTRKYLTIFIN